VYELVGKLQELLHLAMQIGCSFNIVFMIFDYVAAE